MNFFNRLYQHINILSLDVVAGAIISALFFAQVFAVRIKPHVLAALAVTVWIIYTIDHLRDAMSIPAPASTDRHRFHQQHFKVISSIVGVMIAVDITLLFFLPGPIFWAGLGLGGVVLLYLVFQRYLKFLKEIFVAFLYTAGVVLPSLPYAVGGSLMPVHYLILGKFMVTALMNLLLFSLFDLHVDRSQQQHSFVTWFGARPTSYGILFLGLVNISGGMWLWKFDMRLAGIFVAMNLLLLTILMLRRKLVRDNYYRILGDAVFFIPILYLL